MTDLAVLPVPHDPLTFLLSIPNYTPPLSATSPPTHSSFQQPPFVQSSVSSLPDPLSNHKLRPGVFNQLPIVSPALISQIDQSHASVADDDTTRFSSTVTTDTSQYFPTSILPPNSPPPPPPPLPAACMSPSNVSLTNPTPHSSLPPLSPSDFVTHSTTEGPSIHQFYDATASLTAVIHRALRIPSQHPWLCGLLNNPQAVHERVANASPFQHAGAALISLPITPPVHSVSEQLYPSPSHAQHTLPHTSTTHFHCALTPLLSRDTVTLCAATDSEGHPIPAAFDNKSAELFILPNPDTAICIIPCVNAATVVTINFINGFSPIARSVNQSLSNQRRDTPDLTSFVRSVTVIDVPCTPPPSPMNKSFSSLSAQCAIQANRHSALSRSQFQAYTHTPPQIHLQRVQTTTPSHPLDFTVLARNVAALTTNHTLARVQTCSDFTTLRPSWTHQPDVSFALTVTTDAQTVSQWAALARCRLPQTNEHSTTSSLSLQQYYLSHHGSRSPSQSQSHSHSHSHSHSESHSHSVRGEDSHPSPKTKTRCSKKGTGPPSMELRKIRNRESAARSNLRRKQRTEALKFDLTVEKEKLAQIQQHYNQLKAENEQLKIALSHHTSLSSP